MVTMLLFTLPLAAAGTPVHRTAATGPPRSPSA